MSKNVFLLIIITLATTYVACGQTSKSEVNGFWTNASSWQGGSMPGSISSGTVTANLSTIVINGTIKSRQNLTLNASSLTINASDTLVVLGNLSAVAATTIVNNGVLVIYGSVTNGVSGLTNNGTMVVTGNYTNALGANAFTGPSYVYGTTSGFIGTPAVSKEPAFTLADPTLHTWVSMMYGSLPVDLISFTATTQRNDVHITWQTASEINNDFFYIERSIDGIYFERISIVKGSGNSKNKKRYEIVDQVQTAGDVYYRLNQVDYDGKTTRFKTIHVDIESCRIQLYPNPTSDKIILSLEKGNYNVMITDEKGVVHYNFNYLNEDPSASLELDVHEFRNGLYYVKLSNLEDHKVRTYTLVKKS